MVAAHQLTRHVKIFLERGGTRVINSNSLEPPRPNCAVCSAVHGKVFVDPGRATLSDLIELLRSELHYGEEFSIVNNKKEVIYDPDFDDNVSKKLRDVTNDLNYVTVLDEDDQDQDPRTTLELFFAER